MLRLTWAAAAFALLAPRQEQAGEAWTLACDTVSVDSCGVSCPCLLGLEPHHGTCRFLNAIRIREGRHGNVSLDGLSFAIFGEFRGEARSPQFRFVAFYLPKDATEEQRRALKAILGGPPFSGMGRPAGFQAIDVQVTVPQRATDEHRIRLGEKGAFSITPLRGTADPARPIKVTNPVYPFPVPEITVGRAEGRFQDHGRELDLTAHSGEIGTFTLSGRAADSSP